MSCESDVSYVASDLFIVIFTLRGRSYAAGWAAAR